MADMAPEYTTHEQRSPSPEYPVGYNPPLSSPSFPLPPASPSIRLDSSFSDSDQRQRGPLPPRASPAYQNTSRNVDTPPPPIGTQRREYIVRPDIDEDDVEFPAEAHQYHRYHDRVPSPAPRSSGTEPLPHTAMTIVPPQVFEDIIQFLKEVRQASLAAIDSQREMMRYMRDLNEWLARDVVDRQQEIRAVAARVDSLRDDLLQQARDSTERMDDLLQQARDNTERIDDSLREARQSTERIDSLRDDLLQQAHDSTERMDDLLQQAHGNADRINSLRDNLFRQAKLSAERFDSIKDDLLELHGRLGEVSYLPKEEIISDVTSPSQLHV